MRQVITVSLRAGMNDLFPVSVSISTAAARTSDFLEPRITFTGRISASVCEQFLEYHGSRVVS